MAPRARFELATLRLTAERSTLSYRGSAQHICFHSIIQQEKSRHLDYRVHRVQRRGIANCLTSGRSMNSWSHVTIVATNPLTARLLTDERGKSPRLDCECPLHVILRLEKNTGTTLPCRVFRERAAVMGFAPASRFRVFLAEVGEGELVGSPAAVCMINDTPSSAL